MLARCPHCHQAHTLYRSVDIQAEWVHCRSCGNDFRLLPALEIGGAGEPAHGAGIVPIDTPVLPNPENPPSPYPTTDAPDQKPRPAFARPVRHAGGTGLVAGLILLSALLAQLLLVPPLPPGAQPRFDQTREWLCEHTPCPAWHAPRAPAHIHVSTPDLLMLQDRHLQVRFVLQSRDAQPWPVLDLLLYDRLDTPRGRVRLYPQAYTPNPAIPMQAAARYPVTIEVETPTGGPFGVRITPR